MGNGIAPDLVGDNPQASFRPPQNDRWNWQTNLYRVSEDHTAIEKLPVRTADAHLNVTPFV